MLKPRITELLPRRVLTVDRREIRVTMTQNHLGYVGFTTKYPNSWHKKSVSSLQCYSQKIFSKGIIALIKPISTLKLILYSA